MYEKLNNKIFLFHLTLCLYSISLPNKYGISFLLFTSIHCFYDSLQIAYDIMQSKLLLHSSNNILLIYVLVLLIFIFYFILTIWNFFFYIRNEIYLSLITLNICVAIVLKNDNDFLHKNILLEEVLLFQNYW